MAQEQVSGTSSAGMPPYLNASSASDNNTSSSGGNDASEPGAQALAYAQAAEAVRVLMVGNYGTADLRKEQANAERDIPPAAEVKDSGIPAQSAGGSPTTTTEGPSPASPTVLAAHQEAIERAAPTQSPSSNIFDQLLAASGISLAACGVAACENISRGEAMQFTPTHIADHAQPARESAFGLG